ncbi:hypothetical protein NRF20_42185 [Streptomyces sp. R-74717]|uniref:hypothetical protein n=1 Tax=Streptomyces sp. R-74717 TaxID=2969820 RepID=UPI0039B5CC08
MNRSPAGVARAAVMRASASFALPVDSPKKGGQQRQLGPGPLVHPGLHPGPGLLGRALARLIGHGATQGAHRAGSSVAQRAMSW